jgi:hypothetical protein
MVCGDFGHDEIRQRRSLWRIHAAEGWHKRKVRRSPQNTLRLSMSVEAALPAHSVQSTIDEPP